MKLRNRPDPGYSKLTPHRIESSRLEPKVFQRRKVLATAHRTFLSPSIAVHPPAHRLTEPIEDTDTVGPTSSPAAQRPVRLTQITVRPIP